MTRNDLASLLQRLDGRPYSAYKDLRGRYDFGNYTLSIDRVQGDPFAAPSRLSISIDHQQSALPARLLANRSRRIGVENALAQVFSDACRAMGRRAGSGKSGLLAIDEPGPEMLARSCVEIGESRTVARFAAGLPAHGRRIVASAAIALLLERIPAVVAESLLYRGADTSLLERFAQVNEDADCLRAWLSEAGLLAFVADGSILPRLSGADPAPLPEAAPFEAPDSLRAEVHLPNAGLVRGMGLPQGVTLIVGGGYHGKSTLLQALELGVYNHRPGDGRELVVTRGDAVKVRAEDGRSVASVDLSPFIGALPGGRDTRRFSTQDASGSTSQAASILEALEAGSRALLIDEDISATNFLIRDARMQRLVTDDQEPITPFVQRVGPLFEQLGVSTVLVLGSSSDYFGPAHRVIAMDNFLPRDVTRQAKALLDPQELTPPSPAPLDLRQPPRYADPSSLSPYRSPPAYRGSSQRVEEASRPPRHTVKAHLTRSLVFGEEDIDLSLVPQLAHPSQTRTIGALLAYCCEQRLFDELPLIEALAAALATARKRGLSYLGGHDLAEVRLYELAAATNRMRGLRIRSGSRQAGFCSTSVHPRHRAQR